MTSTDPYPFNPLPPATAESPVPATSTTPDASAPATSTTTTTSASTSETTSPDVAPVDPRDEEIAQLQAVVDELRADAAAQVQAGADKLAGSTSTTDTSSSSAPTSSDAKPALRAGNLVAQGIDHATHGGVTRYGVVVKIDDPVIVGVAADGTDTEAAHADVVWFGVDGRTTVAVDELDLIV